MACGGDGSIDFVFTNVADGTYTINYDGGSFTNVSVTSNTATVSAPQGTYNNFSITTHSTCTSGEDPDVVLSDPGIPEIMGVTENDPVTCGGNDGSIGLTINAHGSTHQEYGVDDGNGIVWTSNNPVPGL